MMARAGREDAGLAPPWRGAHLGRRARRLECLTIAWMVVEAGVAVAAGIAAASVALVGFGLDSRDEIFAAAVVLREVHGRGEPQEQPGLRLIAGSSFGLAAHIGVTSTRDLLVGARPGHSLAGMVVTVLLLREAREAWKGTTCWWGCAA